MPLDLKRPLPLYVQMAEDLSGKIARGELRVGQQIGSHRELSRDYRVSLITVKKALSHLSLQGWIYSHVGKGSFVARTSPAPPQAEHRAIGVVLENLRSPFFSLIVQAVEEAAYQSGYNVLLSNSSGRAAKEEQQIKHLRRIGVSGLIIASLRHEYHATPTIQTLHREGFPFVMVSYMDDPGIPFVRTDHERGAQMATRHLIRGGYERIGYVNAERGNMVGELRKRGFLRALQEAGREENPRFLYRVQVQRVRDYYRAGLELGERLCRARGTKPDALFIYNDTTALGVQKALLRHGCRIPEDLAMVGFDNIPEGEYAAVPLTTIDQQTSRIGHDAVEILVRKIEGRRAAERRILEPSLILRESSGLRTAKPRRRTVYA
jgi:DNA-binding LacI/PurR family transcriptional regulator